MAKLIREVFLRRKSVEARTGLSRSSIYALGANGQFPKPIKLTENGTSVAWKESDIQKWIDDRIAASKTEAA